MSADDITKIISEAMMAVGGLMFLWWLFFHKE
jgi:hypothetical protein